MIKFSICLLAFISALMVTMPEVKVSGSMKNIMVYGNLSASINIDTVHKTHLYGLGPVAGLKGEMMIIDGKVFSSSINDNEIIHQQNKNSRAAMLVYSTVEQWKSFKIKANVNSYAELEKLVEKTAKDNGYDMETPFTFKIDLIPQKVNYHIIDWKEGTAHTMNNHKQFAFSGMFEHKKVLLLGFYSTHHQSIFTHHTSFMHIHILDEKTQTVGHLDDLQINDALTIYLPEK